MAAKAKKGGRRALALAFDKAVGVRITAARQTANVMPSVVAKKLGRSVAQVYRLEAGATAPRSYDLVEMAKLYGCKVADFFEGL